MAAHEHQWREIGRVFQSAEIDSDPVALSPHGLHDASGQLVEADALKRKGGKLYQQFVSQVPTPTPHVIVQCQAEDCPQGPKHIEHWDLTKPEAEALAKAFADGRLDPDGNGTNRLVSQASLSDLGLARLDKKLAYPSGASEVLV